jgi:hypothetical protein
VTASANGLFRAMGKRARQVSARLDDGTYVKVDQLSRRRQDFYATPDEVTDAFLAAELDRLAEFPVIWEPACGALHLARRLAYAGFSFWASDLIDRGVGAEIRSFYDFAAAPAPAIVTNPPWDQCNWRPHRAKWIGHALDLLQIEYMALLLPWAWPGAGGMRAFYDAHRPARVYLIRWKVDFTNQGSPPSLHGFFVWDRRHQGETAFRMLDRIAAGQSDFFKDSSP